MIIYSLIAQRNERYAGEYAPEVLASWDESTEDENPAYPEEQIHSARVRTGPDSEFRNWAVLAVNVPDIAVTNALRTHHKVAVPRHGVETKATSA